MLPRSLLLLCLASPVSLISIENTSSTSTPLDYKDDYSSEESNWQCGNDFITKAMSEGQIETDCAPLKDDVNNCCIAHDKCYDDQKGKRHCDEVFCQCLLECTAEYAICHKEDAPLFCALVKQFGDESYEAARNASISAASTPRPTYKLENQLPSAVNASEPKRSYGISGSPIFISEYALPLFNLETPASPLDH